MPGSSESVLRLHFPSWQGGDNPDYLIGGKVLAAIAPEVSGPVEEIRIDRPADKTRLVENGIVSRTVLLQQTRAAHAAIARHQPSAIVTLGGDCLVDFAPMAYLSARYSDDLAVLWIDAHPDVIGPAPSQHAHAFVVSLLMGEGDPDLIESVSKKLSAKDILYVGLTETTPREAEIINGYNISRLSPEALGGSSEKVLEWLRLRGAKHVAVHFDVDVLNPGEHDFLSYTAPDVVGSATEPVGIGRMKWSRVATILNDVAAEFDLVGLAITEYLPWSVITFAKSLEDLPLLGKAQK
jgi:arginase